MVEELNPCKCGETPEFRCDGMLDYLKCPKCGEEEATFFDGCDEWLTQQWNVTHEGEIND